MILARAKSGDPVKYTYVFTNAGDQLLELSGVQACGCITANLTRKVEPGKTGTVPISFNSAGYSGPVTKAISVTCNDKTNPRPVLQFKGTIWKPIDVIPQFAVLNLTADAPLASATVLITNNMPEPITLSAPQCSNPAFAAELHNQYARQRVPGRHRSCLSLAGGERAGADYPEDFLDQYAGHRRSLPLPTCNPPSRSTRPRSSCRPLRWRSR